MYVASTFVINKYTTFYGTNSERNVGPFVNMCRLTLNTFQWGQADLRSHQTSHHTGDTLLVCKLLV